MNRNTASEISKPSTAHIRSEGGISELSLGQLIEMVASVGPEEQVAETVMALFNRGFASFSQLLSRDERAALRNAS